MNTRETTIRNTTRRRDGFLHSYALWRRQSLRLVIRSSFQFFVPLCVSLFVVACSIDDDGMTLPKRDRTWEPPIGQLGLISSEEIISSLSCRGGSSFCDLGDSDGKIIGKLRGLLNVAGDETVNDSHWDNYVLHSGDGNDILLGGHGGLDYLSGTDYLFFGGLGDDILHGVDDVNYLDRGAGDELSPFLNHISNRVGDTMNLKTMVERRPVVFLLMFLLSRETPNDLQITWPDGLQGDIVSIVRIYSAYERYGVDPGVGKGNSIFTINIQCILNYTGVSSFLPDLWSDLEL